jgi:hypothetical protein
MATLEGLPVTEDHPAEFVSTKNANDFIVGMSSNTPKRIYAPKQGDSEEYIQQKVTFFGQDCIDKIQDGKKRELSLGYECLVDETPGTWKGRAYDCVQRDIRYNHLSLVDRARGGPSCRVITDSDDPIKMQICDGVSLHYNNDKPQEKLQMKVLLIDGVKHEVSDEIHAAYTKSQNDSAEVLKRADAKQKELEKLQAIKDDLDEKLNQDTAAENKKMFDAAVKGRVDLEGQARKIIGDDEELSLLTDSEIKSKVVLKVRPKANLDGKDEIYIDARYEMALEDAEDAAEATEKKVSKRADADRKIGKVAVSKQADSYETLRAKKFDAVKEAWKKPIMG